MVLVSLLPRKRQIISQHELLRRQDDDLNA
jgi:hypothetical protein